MTTPYTITTRNLKFNAASVLCARLTVPALNVVLVVGITRLVGFALLGQYTLLLTLVLLADAAKTMGLQNFVVREVAKASPEAGQCYQSLIRVGLFGTVACMPLFLMAAWFSSPGILGPATLMMLALLPGCVISANEAMFLARGRASITAKITLIENIIRLSVSFGIVLWGGHVILALAAAYTGARFLAAGMGIIAMRRHHDVVPPHNRSMTIRMLRSAPEFAAVFVLPMVLFRLDVILLGLLAGDFAVGVYSAAMRFISVLVMIPDAIMSATFALLSKHAAPGDAQEFNRLVDKTVQLLSVFLTPVAILMVLSAPVFLRILYGARGETAAAILQILAWAMIPFALTRAIGDSLVALGGQRAVASAILGTMLISGALYIVLIRQYGAAGAAMAFCGSATALLALLFFCQNWAPRTVTSPARLMRALAPGLLSTAIFFATGGPARTPAVIGAYVFSSAALNWRFAYGRMPRVAEP